MLWIAFTNYYLHGVSNISHLSKVCTTGYLTILSIYNNFLNLSGGDIYRELNRVMVWPSAEKWAAIAIEFTALNLK